MFENNFHNFFFVTFIRLYFKETLYPTDIFVRDTKFISENIQLHILHKGIFKYFFLSAHIVSR